MIQYCTEYEKRKRLKMEAVSWGWEDESSSKEDEPQHQVLQPQGRLASLKRRSDHRVHRLVTSAFWRSFSHEGKIGLGWRGWGMHAHPLLLHLPSPVSCSVRSSWVGRYTDPVSSLVKIGTLWFGLIYNNTYIHAFIVHNVRSMQCTVTYMSCTPHVQVKIYNKFSRIKFKH